MRQAELEQRKQQLLEMHDRLRRELKHLDDAIRDDIRSPGEVTDVPTHNADRDSEGVETNLAIERNEHGLHDAVEDALDRVEAGTYGTCRYCGADIGAERLKAIPYADRCIACAEKQDAG